MKTIGLFEAKTRLSEICREVRATGDPVLVTRRGKAMVRIEPAERNANQPGVWRLRDEWIKRHGPPDVDFQPPERVYQPSSNPLLEHD